MKSWRCSIAIAVVLLPAGIVAQAGHETALSAYRRAVVALLAHRGGASVEQVFDRGLRVRTALLEPDGRGVTVIESLSSTEFDLLKRQFQGFVLNRDEAVYANPDPEFFVGLAHDHGDGADRAFFDAYRQTRPAGVWPVWVEQQTDASGCTRFGAGQLVSIYRMWSDFRRGYPRRYRDEVGSFVGAVEYEVSESTCACGDAAAVLGELEQFDRAFPQSAVGEAVRRRIREIHENRSPIRFGCTSGPVNRVLRW